MGVVNRKMGVTSKISHVPCTQSVLCLPIQKFLRAPLAGMLVAQLAQDLKPRGKEAVIDECERGLRHPPITSKSS